MSSVILSVEEYIASQPKYTWRRWLLRSLIRTVGFSLVRVEASGKENVPDTGPALLMMNHIGFIDPVVCAGMVTNRFVISMSKAENMNSRFVRFFINMWGGYIVNRGIVDRKALVNSIELMKSDQLILIAPEGTRHPEGLAYPKDGLAYVATKADAVVIPTALSGTQDALKRITHFRRGYARINFGKPFKFKTEGRKRIPREELSAMMTEAMYQLALAIPEEYAQQRGVYSDIENASTKYLEFIDPQSVEYKKHKNS